MRYACAVSWLLLSWVESFEAEYVFVILYSDRDTRPFFRFVSSPTCVGNSLVIRGGHKRALAIRFSEKAVKEIDGAARKRGFSSPSAFIRYAVDQELLGRQDEVINAEERFVASIDQVRHEVLRLARAQQALFRL